MTQTGLIVTLPSNHSIVLSNMHPHASGLMKAKYEGDKISEIPGEQMIPAIRSAIQDCFKSLGHWDSAKDANVLEHQTKEMITYFISTFKNTTIQEFKIILRNMVAGEYRIKKDEIITCSVQSMCHAVKYYYLSEIYKMSFTDYHTKLKLDAPVKKELTPEEQQEIVRKGCINAYRCFLIDGSLPTYGGVYYKYLKPRLKIEWSAQEKTEIETIAKQLSVVNETNYSTECKNTALKKWFEKMKRGFNYDKFASLLENYK